MGVMAETSSSGSFEREASVFRDWVDAGRSRGATTSTSPRRARGVTAR